MTWEPIQEFADALRSIDVNKLFVDLADDTCTVSAHIHIACIGKGMWSSDGTLDDLDSSMAFMIEWLIRLKCLDLNGYPTERLDEITFIDATFSLMLGSKSLRSVKYAVVDKDGLHLY